MVSRFWASDAVSWIAGILIVACVCTLVAVLYITNRQTHLALATECVKAGGNWTLSSDRDTARYVCLTTLDLR